MFSKQESDYIKSQRLARFATVNSKGQPDVVPVGFEFDGKYFWIGSHDQKIFYLGMKYKNVNSGNKLVSLTVDDLASVNPWKPRSVKVYGVAEIMDHEGIFGRGKYIRVTPRISWSMGIPGLELAKNQWRLKTVHEA